MLFRTGLGILSWKGTGTNTLATRGLLTLAQIRHYHTEVAAADVRVDELGCVHGWGLGQMDDITELGSGL